MTDRTCSIEDCSNPPKIRGWCTKHYQRWRKHGDPLTVTDRSAGVCSFDGCSRKHYAKSLCHSHWKQRKRGGSLTPLSGIAIPFEQRLCDRVAKTEGCWLWTGHLDDDGYGVMYLDTVTWKVHRYFYDRHHGPIPANREVDHTCFVRNCVNPAHLRLATRKQQNEYRKGPQQHSRTGVRGVYVKKGNRFKKYGACVGHNGRTIHVGYFYTIEEAEAAVVAKRRELFTRY